ncbi:MAG: hypothetical protein HDS75_03530 [Bacteroidales bacterium]|nr:hypothetical protein [Bacteroidales bacterium]
MNHKTLTSLALSAVAVLSTIPSLSAEMLTPSEALSRAIGTVTTASATSASAYTLSHTVVDADSKLNSLYIFTPERGSGYLILPADDIAEPILGYSPSAPFSADEMPPAMQWWLSEYSRQIEAARHSSATLAIERPDRDPIEPMVTTTWNQDAPYNAMCPVYNGQRSVTGCVATAMAQVVNYHQWPATGVGSYKYFYNNAWISLDFSKINFDWTNMLPSYANGAGNEAQKKAVAELMYACGVSVDMNYSPIESGAADVFVAGALVDHFNYDRGVRYAERDYFGLLDWEDFIYGQLRDYGPVQYSGSGAAGGHSFVCDGYSSDGFFHFNWGWGGISDGYFQLTALNPPDQGIGGAASGYNYDQAVIANIRKPRNGSQMYLNLMMDQGFFVEPVKTNATKPGDNVKVSGRIINYSIADASGTLGVKFVNNETEEVKYCTVGYRFSIPYLSLLADYTVQIPAGLRTGTYTLTPVMCGTDGIWRDVPVKLSAVQKSIMTVKGGVCTFEQAFDGSLEVKDIDLKTPIYLGNLFRLTATAYNTGDTEFVGKIVPTLASGHTPIAKADPLSVDLLPGESYDIDFTGIFNHFSSNTLPPAGTYTLYMVKEATNEIISEGLEVELHDVPENTAITVSDFTLDGDLKNIDPSSMKFSAKVSCTEGYFGRNLSVVIFPYTSGTVSSVGFFTSPDLFIAEGEETSFTAGGVFAAGEPSKRYIALVFDGQTQVTPSSQAIIFTVGRTSGVDSVEADDEPVEYYNLQGVRVDNPTSGLYIRRQGTHATKVIIR